MLELSTSKISGRSLIGRKLREGLMKLTVNDSLSNQYKLFYPIINITIIMVLNNNKLIYNSLFPL